MGAVKLTITMSDQGQLNLEGPQDFGTVFMLLEAARELTMRRFMPPNPPSQILVPSLALPVRQ